MVNTTSILCPAWFIAAPASGQGKTTITAGIARYHRNQGRHVRVFKTGPDFLDPLILEQASGNPVTPLDLWMTGEDECRRSLYEAAEMADVILIEGVMGLFDGEPSSADMASYFGIPVTLLINVRSMAQTFGAVVHGLTTYRPSLRFAGVIANDVGSERHEQLLLDAMPKAIPLMACVRRDEAMRLPERHLGLVQPREIDDIDERLDAIASVIESCGLTTLPDAVSFRKCEEKEAIAPLLKGKKIGIAKDHAFSFIYAANEQLLEQLGAELIYFSPLRDPILPDVDALWFPGGYPELHLEQLQKNHGMKDAIRDFYQQNKKILAECGGMLYLQETLTDIEERHFDMVGVIPGNGVMRDRGGCQGMQTAPLFGQDSSAGYVRAHAHHRSRSENTLAAFSHGKRQRHAAPGEAIVKVNGLTATYLHLYFPSNFVAIASLFA